jgi:tetratricopeptide (TPR) repeat protein
MRVGALGLNLTRLESPLYTESTISAAYSVRLGSLYLGLSAKGLFADFAENEYTEIDPLFQNGSTAKGFGLDAGLLLDLKNTVSFGLFARNVNRPNLALGEGEESLLPFELTGGVALRSLKVNPCLDFTYRDAKDTEEQDINIHFGLETWLHRDFGLRAGANIYELATGASYRFSSEKAELQLDYAFRYPMPFEIENDTFPQLGQAHIVDTEGSHQFSLSLRLDSLLESAGTRKTSRSLTPNMQRIASMKEAGEYESAISACQRMIDSDKRNKEAHYMLADIYTEMKKYDEAIEHYEHAIGIDHNDPRFHYGLGAVYEQYGDATGKKQWYNKAMIEFAKTKVLDSDYEDVSSRIEVLGGK